MIRGKHGLYLTALNTIIPTDAAAAATGGEGVTFSGTAYDNPQTAAAAAAVKPSSGSAAKTFLLGADGQGVGNRMDCICFVNADHK